MSTINNNGKLAYIYDQTTDSWYPVAGVANQSANYTWSGTHSFGTTATFESVLTAKAGINNFLDTVARDAAIPSPTNGIVAFIRSTNDIQYYFNGAWRVYGDNVNWITKTSGFTLSLSDAGRTVDMDCATDHTIIIPTNASVAFPLGTQIAVIQTGAGRTSFAGADVSVTILSKNSNKKISSRYSPATLIKKAENTWILIGDLTA